MIQEMRCGATFVLGCLLLAASCRSASLSPAARSIHVSPDAFTLASGQSFDIQVTLMGFPAGAAFTCRVEPDSLGTVVVIASACRFTLGSRVLPGIFVIAQIESLADTSTLVIQAR